MNNIHGDKSNGLLLRVLLGMLMFLCVLIVHFMTPGILLRVADAALPIPAESVKRQFATQMDARMKGKFSDKRDGKRLPFQAVEVESVKYDAQRKEYTVRYTLFWRAYGIPTTGTGCYLYAQGDDQSFSGSCDSGEGQERAGQLVSGDIAYQDKTVKINLRAIP